MILIDEESEKLAYAMASAYSNNNNRENATVEVLNECPDVSVDIIRSMWDAIDAYVDINVK